MCIRDRAETEGKTTVRLHTGDPCIYGAIREQMDILDEKGIPYDSCPGVSSFLSLIHILALAAVIVLRKNATVKVLDVMVPVMAGCYLLITVVLIVLNFRTLPSVFARIFQEAFGIRQVVAGGFGAVLMNGVKRGLFSNEAGSGSAPCAAATAETDHPAKVGLGQALGVFIDTILICTCTAMIMLLTPESIDVYKRQMQGRQE